MLLAMGIAACADAAQPAAGHAANATATPANLRQVLEKARPGDVVTLEAGRYGNVALPKRDNAEPITVIARGAMLRSLIVRQTSGWVWRGGTIDGDLPPRQWFDVTIDTAHRIEIAEVTLTGTMVGVTMMRGSSDIVLRGNTATGLQSDGFNVAGASSVQIIGNTCTDMKPIRPVYDAAGKLLKDGTHNDCVQIWSPKGYPVSNVSIIGNTLRGYMQGIGQYNGSFEQTERVTVEDNDIELTNYWHGIYLLGVKGAVVRNNHVSAAPGARQANYPFYLLRPWIKTAPDAVRCGNVVNGEAERAC